MRVTQPHAIQSAALSIHPGDGATVRGQTQELQGSSSLVRAGFSSLVRAGLWHASSMGLATLRREQHRDGGESCGAVQPPPRALPRGPDPRCVRGGWTRTAGE